MLNDVVVDLISNGQQKLAERRLEEQERKRAEVESWIQSWRKVEDEIRAILPEGLRPFMVPLLDNKKPSGPAGDGHTVVVKLENAAPIRFYVCVDGEGKWQLHRTSNSIKRIRLPMYEIARWMHRTGGYSWSGSIYEDDLAVALALAVEEHEIAHGVTYEPFAE